ncbi:MAG: hypothetical protein ACI9K2_007464, partial [Myxococcota bacterium]
MGPLSGPPFVDLFQGEMTFASGDYGYVHDFDVFVFQVPEA